MFPLPFQFRISATLLAILAGLSLSPMAGAEQDAPAVDVNSMVRALKTLREQQTTGFKSTLQAAIQQLNPAAGSAERCTALWEDAIRTTQIDGGGKEASSFKAWKDTAGEVYKEREVQSAVFLQVNWLLITVQRAAGATVKDLLPAVTNYSRYVLADQDLAEALDENIKREKEAGGKGRPGQAAKDLEAVRRTRQEVFKGGLAGSPLAKSLKVDQFVTVDKWETNPTNYDGIFRNIVQPELRAEKDSRVFDYWDAKIKREDEAASRTKLSYEIDKFRMMRGPSLLWERAHEYDLIGLRNRAATEMFKIIKSYPTHPDADDWIKQLQEYLAPAPTEGAPAATPASGAAPATPPAQ